MQSIKNLVLITLLTLFAISCGPKKSSQAQPPPITCKAKEFEGYNVSYCIDGNFETPSKDVIYFFHGLNGSQNTWQSFRLRETLFNTYGSNRPKVISVSFGPRWFLSDVERIFKPSRLATFHKKVQYEIEEDLGFKVENRFAVGESMGGFNALRIMFDQPEKYKKVVALCPAIATISPFSTAKKTYEYLERNPSVDIKILFLVSGFSLMEFPFPYLWDRNDLLKLVDQNQKPLPRLFMSSNSQDMYGFNEGAEIFAEKLRASNASYIYTPLAGSHCEYTKEFMDDVARFLVEN